MGFLESEIADNQAECLEAKNRDTGIFTANENIEITTSPTSVELDIGQAMETNETTDLITLNHSEDIETLVTEETIDHDEDINDCYGSKNRNLQFLEK